MPTDLCELVIQITKVTGFGYARIIGEQRNLRHQEDRPADGGQDPDGKQIPTKSRPYLWQPGHIRRTPCEATQGQARTL